MQATPSKGRWSVALLVLLAWWLFGPWVVVLALLSLFSERVRRFLKPEFKGRLVLVVVALIVGGLAFWQAPSGWFPILSGPGVLMSKKYDGRPAMPHPIRLDPPQNPYLAADGTNSMHSDAEASDTVDWAGPLGEQPEVDSVTYGIEECANISIAKGGDLIATCGSIGGPVLKRLDPKTLRPRASYSLPGRPSGGGNPLKNLCTGVYSYLDNRDQVVVPTTDRRILAFKTEVSGQPRFARTAEHDVSPVVPKGDCLLAALPDWDGRIWFVTLAGVVGYVDPRTGDVVGKALGEKVVNSIAGDQSGAIYVITNQALYRLRAAAQGVSVEWRRTYDRGSEHKSGQLAQGSGTTPTVLPGGKVAITDNAAGQMNVVFVDATSGRVICKTPVFETDHSATENSLVSVGSGVIVENNHGYGSPLSTLLGRSSSPGIARVDLEGSSCKVRWTSSETAPTSVPKVSLENGLAYVYTKDASWTGVDSWYFTGLDVQTGRTIFKVRTGVGPQFNNHYAAIFIGRDGAAYVPTLTGLIRIRDRHLSRTP